MQYFWEDGNPMLENIESDDEYAKAADAFNTILENARKAEETGLENAHKEETGELLD